MSFLLTPILYAQTISWKSNELTFAPGLASRFIAKNIPGNWEQANLVHGLYFKYHRYFFCRREPKGEIFCHLYLEEAHGDFQKYDKDIDFGKGSLEDYANDHLDSSIQRKVKTKLILRNNIFTFNISGPLARRLAIRMLPEYEIITTVHNKTYMEYRGKLIHCRHPLNIPEQGECILAIPLITPSDKDSNKSLSHSSFMSNPEMTPYDESSRRPLL